MLKSIQRILALIVQWLAEKFTGDWVPLLSLGWYKRIGIFLFKKWLKDQEPLNPKTTAQVPVGTDAISASSPATEEETTKLNAGSRVDQDRGPLSS